MNEGGTDAFWVSYFVVGRAYHAVVLTLCLLSGLSLLKLPWSSASWQAAETLTRLAAVISIPLAVAYAVEAAIALSSIGFERFAFINRVRGPSWWAYWFVMLATCCAPHLFWLDSIRSNRLACFVISLTMLVALELEDFVLAVAR